MLYTLRFFSSKCCLFHNANLFGSRVIHISYTECVKIKKKKKSGAKGLMTSTAKGRAVGGERRRIETVHRVWAFLFKIITIIS